VDATTVYVDEVRHRYGQTAPSEAAPAATAVDHCRCLSAFSDEQQIISGRPWHDRAAMIYGNVTPGQAPAAKAPAAKAARVDWETCVAAPTRACLLDDAPAWGR
jgi:hypothetical protein